jgi:hypothetical protein
MLSPGNALLVLDENWDARVQGVAREQSAESLPLGETYQSAANAGSDAITRIKSFEFIAVSEVCRSCSD